ncbi:MAG: hypothetical protein ACTSSK_14880 [Candidatus Heimdallarchaeota archaeon]
MTSITPPPEPLSIEPVELGSKEDKKIRRGKRNFGLSPLIGKTFKDLSFYFHLYFHSSFQ